MAGMWHLHPASCDAQGAAEQYAEEGYGMPLPSGSGSAPSGDLASAQPTRELGEWRPRHRAVLRAVRSLYADQIKPYCRLLVNRLREHQAAIVAERAGVPTETVDPRSMPFINVKALRRVCEKTPTLQVMDEPGAREYSVLLLGVPSNFIDPSNSEDPYPAELWSRLSNHFETIGQGGDVIFSGSRYAAARELCKSNLDFLRGYSLGQACHILELCFAKRLLGHRKGNIVHYWACDKSFKEQCAIHGLPTSAGSVPVAQWETVGQQLSEMLAAHAGKAVRLSNIKRLFLARYGVALSETALGHSSFAALLHDPRLEAILHVDGDFVLPAFGGPSESPESASLCSLQSSRTFDRHSMPVDTVMYGDIVDASWSQKEQTTRPTGSPGGCGGPPSEHSSLRRNLRRVQDVQHAPAAPCGSLLEGQTQPQAQTSSSSADGLHVQVFSF